MRQGNLSRQVSLLHINLDRDTRIKIQGGNIRLLYDVLEKEKAKQMEAAFRNPSYENFNLQRGVILALDAIKEILT